MRDLKVSLLSLALSVLLVGTATAQVQNAVDFQPRNDAGLGAIKRSFNATQLTNVPGISCNNEPKACALTSAIWHKGRFWVFGRECWAYPTQCNDAIVFEWTNDGTVIGQTAILTPKLELGIHAISLVVTDEAGLIDIDEVVIDVVQPTGRRR